MKCSMCGDTITDTSDIFCDECLAIEACNEEFLNAHNDAIDTAFLKIILVMSLLMAIILICELIWPGFLE